MFLDSLTVSWRLLEAPNTPLSIKMNLLRVYSGFSRSLKEDYVLFQGSGALLEHAFCQNFVVLLGCVYFEVSFAQLAVPRGAIRFY